MAWNIGTTVSRGVLRFFVGFVAAVCAVFLPKLVVLLKHEGDDVLVPISTTYWVAGLVFAALVGVVVLILEAEKASKPGEVFMTALGVPALLSGTLSTVGTADNLRLMAELQRRTFVQAAGEAQVPIIDLEAPSKPVRSGAAGPFDWIPSAQAAPIAGRQVPVESALGVKARRYVYQVVLFQSIDESQALARAQALRATFPRVEVVPSAGSWLVTTGERLSDDAALAEAQRVRRLGIRPQLVRIRA